MKKRAVDEGKRVGSVAYQLLGWIGILSGVVQ